MPDTCAQCELPNTTLQWLETAGGFRCVGCATARRAEQTRIEQQWLKQHSKAGNLNSIYSPVDAVKTTV